MPGDLKKALTAHSKAHALWKTLTPIAKRDFTRWIVGARQKETRKRRVERTIDMLLSGKRRPCCYAVVPMNFYKALGSLPKAKATWGTLTPDERRDYVDWIEESPDMRMKRVEKACVALSSGKRRP